jgi:Myosin head (motor domain)
MHSSSHHVHSLTLTLTFRGHPCSIRFTWPPETVQANEKLQQFFNNHMFKLEEKVYQEEGIEWDPIEFTDNLQILKMIEKRLGIVDVLNEESHFPRAT